MCGRGDHPPYGADETSDGPSDPDPEGFCSLCGTFGNVHDPARHGLSQEDRDIYHVSEDVRVEDMIEARYAALPRSSVIAVCDLLDTVGCGLAEEIVDKLDFKVEFEVDDSATYVVTGVRWDEASRRLVLESHRSLFEPRQMWRKAGWVKTQ